MGGVVGVSQMILCLAEQGQWRNLLKTKCSPSLLLDSSVHQACKCLRLDLFSLMFLPLQNAPLPVESLITQISCL